MTAIVVVARRWAMWGEAVLALILAWGLVFLMPWRYLRRWFTPPAQVSLPGIPSLDLKRAQGVAVRVTVVASRLPWHSTCLVRSVAAELLLRRRGIAGSIIRFGVRKVDGQFAAHAWLMLGETILLGGAEAHTYTPLADFTACDPRASGR